VACEQGDRLPHLRTKSPPRTLCTSATRFSINNVDKYRPTLKQIRFWSLYGVTGYVGLVQLSSPPSSHISAAGMEKALTRCGVLSRRLRWGDAKWVQAEASVSGVTPVKCEKCGGAGGLAGR